MIKRFSANTADREIAVGGVGRAGLDLTPLRRGFYW